ncbi:MAG: hypothetical protein WD381_02605 [Balneolaceae bacterium]
MTFKSTEYIINEIIADFSECSLSKAELQSFSELQDKNLKIRKTAQSGIRIHNLLKQLKTKGVSDRFDQKMSAKFAIELENEIRDRNLKMIEANQKAPTS